MLLLHGPSLSPTILLSILPILPYLPLTHSPSSSFNTLLPPSPSPYSQSSNLPPPLTSLSIPPPPLYHYTPYPTTPNPAVFPPPLPSPSFNTLLPPQSNSPYSQSCRFAPLPPPPDFLPSSCASAKG